MAFVLLGCIALCGAARAAGQDTDGDGLPDAVEKRLGSLADRAEKFTPILTVPAADVPAEGPGMTALAAAHVAEDRFLWRIECLRLGDIGGLTAILYLDADNEPTTGRRDKPEVVGTDVMCGLNRGAPFASHHSATPVPHARGGARVEAVGNALYVCADVRLAAEGGKAVGRTRPLLQWKGGGQSADWHPFRIPLTAGRKKTRLPGPRDAEFRGLSGKRVRAAMRGPYPKRRPKPRVPFHARPRHPGRDATVALRRVPVELVEEHGLERKGEPVRFGLPVPEGMLFDPAQARLVGPAGKEVPAQFTITSFWKDESIRWLLCTFMADLKAGARATWTVELGRDVRRAPPPVTVRVEANADGPVSVTTGPLKATVMPALWQVTALVDLDRDGAFAEDETTATASLGPVALVGRGGEGHRALGSDVRVEHAGPLSATVRLSGPYRSKSGKDHFRHITRLTFYAGSTWVDVAHTHIDDHLEHEFADFRSVELPVECSRPASSAAFLVPGQKGGHGWRAAALKEGASARLFQRDDAAFALDGPETRVAGSRAPGAVALGAGGVVPVSVAVEDFWQSYPKALRASRDGVVVELWPDIRGETAYSELPKHLDFPFVEGAYRFKWGMAKTHRIRVRFGARSSDPPVAPWPLVAVLPAAWHEETKALGPMVARRKGEFAAWDEAFEHCFQAHLRRKEVKREYGFFNWGDWHGERGENWGNNEYDLSHGLFTQFARTGDRRYFRLALAGARHQADVDCIHAYPDPAYVGGNVLHSVCHTGEWSQFIAERSWSFRHGYHAMAFNGHTWAEGMCEAWYLAGDPQVMEAAQGLGEHIVYGMVPRFEKLGTHERSAGWSLVAIVALYRATLDPLYLEAARKIAEVAFREQKPGQGSGWPHTLPTDHCRHSTIPGAKRCVGNVAFLIGILHSGLKEYHLESGDPRAAKAITASAPWWKTIWEPEADTFQYTSCPLFRGQTSVLTGIMSADALVYAHELTGDVAYLNMAARSLLANCGTPPGGSGKGFAMFGRFGGPVMAALRKHRDASDTARSAIAATRHDVFVERLRRATPAGFFGIRGPALKRFFVRVKDPKADRVTIARRPHGARTKDWPTGTVTIRDAKGNAVKETTFDTDKPYELDWTPAAPGIHRIEVRDDLRGIWDVASPSAPVVLDCRETVQLGGYRFRRLYFFVPSGTRAFTFEVAAVHGGAFGGAAFDPEGRAHGAFQDTKAAMNAPGGRGRIEVQPVPAHTGKVWSLVLFAGMDLCLTVRGVPPHLSRTPAGWLDPGAAPPKP